MFDEHDELSSYFEGYVVTECPVEHPFQGVDSDWHIKGQRNPGEGTVEFPQGIGVAEKEGKNTIFVSGIDAHSKPPGSLRWPPSEV
jgi:hypothetical protein